MENKELDNDNDSFKMSTLKLNSFNENPINPQKKQHKDSITKKCEKIFESYPQKIRSLFETPKPKEGDVYVMMILNCNEQFYKDYSVLAKRSPSLGNSVMSIPIDNTSNFNDIGLETFQENKNDDVSAFESTNKKFNKKPNPTLEEIYFSMDETQKFQKLIKEIFSEISKSDESLINAFLRSYGKKNSQKLKSDSPEYYEKCFQIYQSYSIKNNPSWRTTNSITGASDESFSLAEKNYFDFYTEFYYEDYIVILAQFITYYTNLKVRLELQNDNKKQAMMIIYGNNETYEKIANNLGYDLQLKPYAYKYALYMGNNKENEEANMNMSLNDSVYSSINESLISRKMKSKFSQLQFRNLSLKNHLCFPPYYPYKSSKKNKYRLYESNDDYHECENDPDFTGEHCMHSSSIFRNIDKLRLIHRALEQIFKFSTLERVGLLKTIIYQRNYISYGERLTSDFLLHNNTKLCVTRNNMDLINTLRNYYGEYIAYYFLWVASFCKWMIFPSIIGFVLFLIIIQEPKPMNGTVETIKKLKLDYYDISKIISCILITIWATLFLKAWKQKEEIFTYIWGMENYQKTEPVDASFKPNKTVPFCFGEKINTITTFSYYFRRSISYIVLTIMLSIRVWIVYYLFSYRAGKEISMENNIIIASISALIIKIMSIIYEYLARALSKWENYEKYSQQQNALASKLILFEFFNNYSNLYYIAFIKPVRKEQCLYQNCFKELEIQLYILLLINFSFNLYEILWPLIRLKWRLRSINKVTVLQPILHSVDYQLLCEGYDTLIYEYNERLISFGFVCLFSVAAPLTPLFVLMLTYLENYVDLYKIFNLLRVTLIEGGTGIDIYNSIFKVFYFIGMLTSTALILFTNNHLINPEDYTKDLNLFKNSDFIAKFLIFAGVENVILIVNTLNLRTTPNWFDHLEDMKSIYYKKYYIREKMNLPHLTNREKLKNSITDSFSTEEKQQSI